MKVLFVRSIAGLVTAMFTLSGCGGSQGQSTGFGAVPQAMAHRGEHHDALSDLIYVSGGCDGVCVLAYPSGHLVSSISLSGLKGGACSDKSGNVFITNDTQVVEYSHGGTTPIATLSVPGNEATGCSVDLTTGNLAVVFNSQTANVAIFPSATGEPALYGAPTFGLYCGYDASGNLFVSGRVSGKTNAAELPAGQSAFQSLSVVGKVGNPGQMQWDGKYMTFESRTKGSIKILRLQISGSTAKVIKTSRLKGIKGQAYQSWLYDGKVLVPYGNGGAYAKNIGVWKYPNGGKPDTRYQHLGTLYGVTVSEGTR